MRIVRVIHEGNARYGLADDQTITLISDEPFAAWEPEEDIPLEGANFMPPVIATKIVCVGLNYHAHAEELGMDVPEAPILFLKPPTALNSPGGDIRVPGPLDSVDFEAELAAVIGRRTHMIGPGEVESHVLGYTCANDVTARAYQDTDGQWTRAKGFDGFCPVGPWIETDVDPSDLSVESYVNGELRQSGRTSDMIFGVPELVSFVSQVMTLLPGDVVLTGTPVGVGPMSAGDVVDVRIQGIGSLANPVV
jgi:2-keto-4-pentenoate hydratase/2-oxohepta-3-ene-1,7-dioic acid hydratase in catechol pathway